MKKYLAIIIGLFVGLYGLWLFNYDAPVKPVKTQATAVPVTHTVVQDERVVALMQNIRVDYSKLNLTYGDNPTLPNAVASFTAPNNVYITNSAPTKDLNIIISHEYMHYVQTTLDKEVAKSFYPYLDSLVANNSWLSWRMTSYINNPTCKTNCLAIEAEIEAVACTEMTDQRLTPEFVNFCNKHLPNRQALLQ